MMGDRAQITLAAELESLSAFGQFIEQFCTQFEVNDQTCYDMKLAVDEACTNVITHGYAGMNPGSIILALTHGPDQVTVEITDFGHPFEPYEPEKPDIDLPLEDLPTGGFGLYFIYQTMDEIRYRTGEDGNVLTLVKYLEPQTAE